MNEMITRAKETTQKRGKCGCKQCEIYSITANDILKLKEKQNNTCV